MQLGMIGLGRMGANMVKRLLRAGHACVVHDKSLEAMAVLEKDGAVGARELGRFVERLAAPRVVWLMIPAALVDDAIAELAPRLAAGDIVIDGGNTHWPHDIRRAKELAARGIRYVDVGTSGGVWGLERGYCLMVGGDKESVARLAPIFDALCPGLDAAPRLPGAERLGSAERGWLHCGPAGAGHFVKMVHNGIEYALMAAYAEGFNLLRHADAGLSARAANAETSPLEHPENYRYEFDLAAIGELWRRGSVIGSWLLDLTAQKLAEDPALSQFDTKVKDSGEGRWTIEAAVQTGVPAHVLSAALFDRFASRGEADFEGRVLSAMRRAFGGH
ncbi:MAG: decarboxylating 6-phosphogluconate dehydrogenase [Planctomycetes bacterium]|nr:decarboxylating 6-phosphogluconate dehydrogenase [Planctomycetota bacterium]